MTISVSAWPKNRNKDENPYNDLIYQCMGEGIVVTEFNYRTYAIDGVDILHVHWPDRLLDDKRKWRLQWRFWRFMRAINRLHERGGKLIWTVHNLRSREIHYPDLADKLLKKFIAKVDGFIFLSEVSRSLFTDEYGDLDSRQYAIIPHPHYKSIHKKRSLQDARKALALEADDFILGFFGKIRDNKGLDTLISSLSPDISDVRLLLAGSAGKRNISDQLKQFLHSNPKTIALLNYIEPQKVSAVIGACNVLIFPYQDILNSGSSVLALSLGRPIIVPDIGSFPEMQAIVGEDWVYLYSQPLTKEKLQRAIDWAKNKMPVTTQPNLDYAEPRRISELTENFYRRVFI